MDNSTNTTDWVNGYASVLPQRFLYDIGDAGGCPLSGTTSTAKSCNAGWTQENVWCVSWGAAPAESLPEIYTTSGSTAAQWYNLSLYSFLAHNLSMIVAGTLTQSQACTQVSGCDQGTTSFTANTAPQGWQQLFDKVNADSRTAQTLSWATAIKWSPQ